MKILIVLFIISSGLFLNVTAQTGEDSSAIKQASLNYIEGWYEGNPGRMEKALHPDLAKRIVHTDAATNRSRLDQMSALTLINYTKAGYGTKVSVDKQIKDITILDIFGNAASVKIVAADWVDYLHLAKFSGEWKIVNVLWELKPKKN